MVSNSLFISVVLALGAVFLSSMALITKMLGDRISDLGVSLGGRVGSVESRMGSLDVRMNSLEGAVRDVGERLTALETDFGNR